MVVSWSRPYIGYVAAILVYCMIPGTGELIENVLHFIEHGHAAHVVDGAHLDAIDAIDDTSHERRGAEHGCSGTYHVCSCCQSPAFIGAKQQTSIMRSELAETKLRRSTDVIADGFFTGIFRPPIA